MLPAKANAQERNKTSRNSSSCDQIPSELIAEILQLASRPPPSRETPDKNYTSPLLLGTVCRRWRAIALDLPTLWKYVYLEVSIDCHDTRVELLEEWLERARDCPLHIVFRVSKNLQGEFLEECEDMAFEIFELFATKRLQWETLDLEVPTQECASTLEAGGGELPLLQAVALTDLASDLEVNLLKDLPSLRQLSLTGSPYFEFSHPPSCATLTELYLSSLNIDDTIPLLREVINIRLCQLRLIDSERYYPIYDEENSRLSFPALESLVIDSCSSSHILGLLGKIPKLRDLSMKGSGYADLSILDRFFAERDFKLDAFHLTVDSSMKLDKIRKVLERHSKTLTSLSIYDHHHDAGSVLHAALHTQLLMPSVLPGKGTLLPNLRQYEYLPPEWGYPPMECVARMLQERWRLLQVARRSSPSKADFLLRLPALVREEVGKLLAKEIEEGLAVNFDLPYPQGF